ncbi:unnamed protein product [Camellia sinensis]
MEEVQLNNSEDVICPICLDFPHNGVLLQCSSYEKGCRPFVCDTDHLHSNCLDRFKTAYGMPSGSQAPSPLDATSLENIHPILSKSSDKPSCPLCRGEVTGWVIVENVRLHLNEKKRYCEENQCAFMGSYLELREHAQLEHPHACPSKIDPARQLDWENFQQSSEIIDVLSTIQSEVPRGVVLGDYVIEYADNDTADEFEDFPGDEGNWWTSCILYQVFDNFRTSRNRRRSRASDSRRGSRNLSYETSNSDEGSVTSVEFAEYRVDETDDEFVSTSDHSRRRSGNLRILGDDVPASMTINKERSGVNYGMEEKCIEIHHSIHWKVEATGKLAAAAGLNI